MLKKKLSQEEAIILAEELSLTPYIELNELIEGLHIKQNKEIKVCLITTDKKVIESILLRELNISVSLYIDCITKISIRNGDERCAVMTEYGEMFINKQEFIEILNTRKDSIECCIMSSNTLWRNITFNIIYIAEYNKIEYDNWRYILMESDKLIIALSSSHILYSNESKFIKSLVVPYFSTARLTFAIGNAQYIKSSEWNDAVMRVKIQLGKEYNVFPIFTEDISEEIKQKYFNHEQTLTTILQETQRSTLDIRMLHYKDLENYKESLLEKLLIELKKEMKEAISKDEQNINMAKDNENTIAKSRKHLENNVNLFLESPLVAKTRNAVGSFAKLLRNSLEEDINASHNIKQDARSLTRYLSAVWAQFIEDQNYMLLKEFEHESAMLIEMIKLDLEHFVSNQYEPTIQEDIKKKLITSLSVNTFFSRKIAAGNSLTDALTIGGLISGILITPLGWMAVLASEIIKVTNKKSIENEYKKELKIKIEEIIEKNKEELLRLTEKRFKEVAQDFHNEIMKYYDDLFNSVRKIIDEGKMKKVKAVETLEHLNTII